MHQLPTWGDDRKLRIGLLGGSFNPIHKGHLQLANQALKVLRLDQVWLMVSPGNPLKAECDMAPFSQRLERIKECIDDKRILATDIEKRLGTRYTYDTLKLLKKRFPRCQFVWLMGADNLAQMSNWLHWKKIVHTIPVAVFPRPTYRSQALKGRVSSYLRQYRLPSKRAALLTNFKPPLWSFVSTRENSISATVLRIQGSK
ncbi:nicotinate-nucleotide adenylyltransferase [Commensalibacter sp. Nvir]|uniref:nicotinate-nucleotide adenylyltransferase n=1 Tax=Commensalibacter sp. Nvir TaxID=3069817 RepID=UPI002D3A1163|nr:nicotinate-nucleotide adenylyltransferase [Commensalibacter sp. Nvir]